VSAKLYVGNVSYDAKGEDLSMLFAECGTVLASRIIVDRVTGKSRGFGFVEMSTENEAEAAIGRFNGHRLFGRALLVHLAHDNRELSRRAREAKARQRAVTTTPGYHQPNAYHTPMMHHTMSMDMRPDMRTMDLNERIERMRRPLRRTLRDRAI
jgi:RNA recognition motif-containing protein